MLWMHKTRAIETMSRVEARETEKKISRPCADANREIKYDCRVREGEALYGKIERTRSARERRLSPSVHLASIDDDELIRSLNRRRFAR